MGGCSLTRCSLLRSAFATNHLGLLSNSLLVFGLLCARPTGEPLDICLNLKYLDIKVFGMSVDKLESLTGGSGVHVFLVLWKAAQAVEAYAKGSIEHLELCGRER